jgi:hypothetical protein
MTVIRSQSNTGAPAWNAVGSGLRAVAWLPNDTPVVVLEEQHGMLQVLTTEGVVWVYKENVVTC